MVKRPSPRGSYATPRRGTTELVSTVVMPPVASLSTVSPRTPRLNEKCSSSDHSSFTKNDVVLMSILAPRVASQLRPSVPGPGLNTGTRCSLASTTGLPSGPTA